MLKPNPDKLDCSVSVVTPENIEFEYLLAGPFQRLPAYLFDVMIRIVVWLAFLFAGFFVLAWIPFGIFLQMVGLLLLWFVFSWFYGIYFETRFNGRTLGKMVFKLRVISVDGRPINGVQAAIRNVLRLADMYVPVSLLVFDPEGQPVSIIPTFIVGLTAMSLSSRYQRLGDMAAGTMVISEHAKRSPWSMQPDDLRSFGLAELIPATFPISSSLAKTTGLYMENRKRLSPARRLDVAKHIAGPLIERFEMLPDTSADLLMCALYVRIFMSEEQRQLGRERMREVAAPRMPPPIRTAFVTPSIQTTPPPLGTSINQPALANSVAPPALAAPPPATENLAPQATTSQSSASPSSDAPDPQAPVTQAPSASTPDSQAPGSGPQHG
ncbi:MAG: RDD family protein [Pirellulaceae bacterium]